MKVRDGLRIAGRSLKGHRIRSALTVVGIVIGIGTVILFASFGTSVQTDVIGEFEDTAASEILVVTGDVGLDPDDTSFGDGPPPAPDQLDDFALPGITTHDIEQLRQTDGVESVIVRGSVDDVTALEYDNQTEPQSSLTATTPAAFSEEDILEGRSFEQGESGAIVMNEQAAEAFEGNLSAGDSINIEFDDRAESENATVVGIVEQSRGGLDFGGFGESVYVPTDPYYETYGFAEQSPTTGVEQAAYRQVTVIASDPEEVSATSDAVETYFQEESDATRILETEITVQAATDIIDGIESVLDDIIQLVSGIGVLALLVGAFGIANIMLVSVTERTKEIGIMKANGAQNREVMGLFLAEAVLLGLIGAVIGIPLGLLGGYGAALYADVGFTVPIGWVLVGATMGILTGVVSGLYPAWRAASVDPIDALRYE